MGETTDGSRSLKLVAALVCALLLTLAGIAAQPGAQAAKDGRQAAGSKSKKQGKKCATSLRNLKAKKNCRKKKAPKITRGEAIVRAIDAGRVEAQRPVTVSRATRNGRSSFSVVVGWTKRPPIGTQDCSLDLTIRKKHPRTVVTRIADSGCDSIEMHRDVDRQFQRGPGPKYCPATVENSWNAKSLEGKTVQEAATIAAEHGCEVRIVREDGEWLAVTMDLRFNRLNVEVEGPEQRIVRINSVA